MEQQINEMMLMLGEIRGDVKGINTRLDISNGRIAKSEGRIDTLESINDQQKGSIRVVGGIWKVIAGFGGIGAIITVARMISGK